MNLRPVSAIGDIGAGTIGVGRLIGTNLGLANAGSQLLMFRGGGAPTDFAWQVGFGTPFYKDAGKTQLATLDGDLVYTAADSVAAQDLVQSSSGQRPILDLYSFTKPSLQFRHWKAAYASSSGPTVSTQAFTICIQLKMLSLTNIGQEAVPWFFGSSPVCFVDLKNQNPTPPWQSILSGSGNFLSQAIDAGATTVVARGSASAFSVRINGTEVGPYGAGSVGSIVGMVLGGFTGGSFPAHVSITGMRVWNRVLSPAEVSLEEAAIASYASLGTLFPTTAPQFTFLGDSLTTGANASDENHSYPAQMFSLLTNGAALQRGYANLGLPGETIVQWLLPANLTIANQYYNSGRTGNVMFIFCGTNDLNSVGRTGAQVYADMKTLGTACKATGKTIVALDMLPRNTVAAPANETQRGIFNTSLAGDFTTTIATNVKTGGAAYADYLIQLSGDTNIGVTGADQNATYYNSSDFTHLTNAGYAVVAGYVKTVMNLRGYT